MDAGKEFHVDDGKSDDTAVDSGLASSSRKQSPRSSPGRINNELSHASNSENLPSNVGIDPHDSRLPSSMIDGLATASGSIPYPRMQNTNHPQQMFMYQQAQAPYVSILHDLNIANS